MATDDPQGTGAADSKRDRLADPFAKKARATPPPPLPGTGAAPPPRPRAAPEPEPEPEPEPAVEPVETTTDGEPELALSDADLGLLAEAQQDLVAEYKDRAARAEAELANFRMRVDRDRQANREAVVAEVIRSLLPAIDDLDRAEEHGDLEEGSPLAIVAQKLRTAIERHGLKRIGEVGDPFDPNRHEALVQKQSGEVSVETIAHVIEPGYLLGERVIRPAKVAVDVPE